jgi:hypothetical protein
MTRERWTEAELAAYLRVKPITLRNWRWRRVGPPYIKAGGRVLYDPEVVYRWEREHTVTTEACGITEGER